MSEYREEMEPLLSVMVKPRITFRFMIENKKFTYALYTGAVAGIASMLITMYGSSIPAGYGLGDVVYSSIVSGVLFFMLSNLAMSFLFAKLGEILKGKKGSFREMFQTICMASAPYFWIMPVILFWLQFSSHTFFMYNFKIDLTLKDVIWSYVGLFSVAVAGIWSVVLMVIGISEVHQFSKWKAFFTFIIASGAISALGFVLMLNM